MPGMPSDSAARVTLLVSFMGAEDMPAKQVFQCSTLHSDNPLWPVAQQSARSAAIVQAAMGYATAERRPIARETVDALAEQLLEITRAGPALVVFEDTQWADRATLELMRHLVGAVADLPVLLIVTSRPDDEPYLGTA